MQLEALAQSGFDPLSRTCRFMLTEEAHHMFVGENGVRRVIKKTCEMMNKAGISDPYDISKIRELGVIDLPTIQKKINLHYSLSLDLFGSEISTNAANTYTAGVKGRFWETKIKDDHILKNDTYPILEFTDGQIINKKAPALLSLNMRLRDDYTKDTAVSIKRWNRTIEEAKINFEMKLPFEGFNRKIGTFMSANISPLGDILTKDTWDKDKGKFLPTTDDNLFIESLMKPVSEPGRYADWISAPDLGIDNKPGDFEYVKIHDS
jgi:benzoyl-CoA 2,3-dioxygenase component B